MIATGMEMHWIPSKASLLTGIMYLDPLKMLCTYGMMNDQPCTDIALEQQQ
jgi:hypothetical protein